MTLTVGTNCYDTSANVDTYWSDRGNTDWAALSTADKELNIIKATDWLERNFEWRGNRATSDQRLHWPADCAYDDDDFQIGATEAPWQVKEAMAIIADLYRQGTYDMEGILTDDNAVKRQKVDVIEVEYDRTLRLRGQAVITHVYALLRPVTVGWGLLRA